MTLGTLEQLYEEHTGKVADKWSGYLREYERVLSPYRDAPVNLLEIGIQNGGSLDLWATYFKDAQRIVGCDINPNCADLKYEDPRVSVVVIDANTSEAQGKIASLARQFDIIIDDGSHKSSAIVQSFARYFPVLADGGLYVIEDLHCSYWHEFEGGLFDAHSSMTFLKRLADVINHEHWGVPRFRTSLTDSIASYYNIKIHEQDLAKIHSIEFVNSMCVIRKAPSDSNLLGSRWIVGTEEMAFAGIRELNGSPRPEAQDQAGNPWSQSPLPPEEDLLRIQAELASVRAEVANQVERARQLEQVSADKDQQLADERTRWMRALYERDRQLQENTSTIADLIAGRDRNHQKMSQEVARVRAELASARDALADLQGSMYWRATAPLRNAVTSLDNLGPAGGFYRTSRRIRKVLRQQGLSGATKRMLNLATGTDKLKPPPKTVGRKVVRPRAAPAPGPDRFDYGEWLRQYDTLTREHCAALSVRAERFAKKPLISIIVPTYNAKPEWLSEAIDSVRRQVYTNWELCIVDDASTSPSVRTVLDRYAELDPRIRVHYRPQNGHISLATNDGFNMARGQWFALLDHDDLLREHALFWVVQAINDQPDIKLIYSDEDKLLGSGARAAPYFKPDFNRELFLSYNMICHLGVYDAALVREVGGCRQGFEGAQDYDLALRCIEKLTTEQIHHIPRVLYSWRVHEQSTASAGDAKPYAALAGERALNEHFARTGVKASAELRPDVSYRTRYALPDQPPLVTIVIPTRNAEKLVKQCVDSVRKLTLYKNYEILLIDNGSDDPSAVAYFKKLESEGAIRILRDDRVFNYSALNNAAVKVARGELICLMNNDIEVISEDWLGEMVSIAVQPGVGAVGARLWYPNDLLQHGGVVLGIGGVAGHSHKGAPRNNRGYYARADVMQCFSAVTAACLVVRKAAFEQVGGLNEIDLKVAFNDVDFCLRLLEAGYRNVWTPYADLYHHESATRGYEDSPAKIARFEGEVRFMKTRWGSLLANDPAYNPNLSGTNEDFAWAWPPRLPELYRPEH